MRFEAKLRCRPFERFHSPTSRMMMRSGWMATVLAIGVTVAPAGCVRTGEPVLTFSGSVVGREAEVIRRQLERFGRAHPSIDVALRATPDAADQRHQLYVQWLNARASDPDVLQLDVVWTAEFAAAGWIADLDRFHPRRRSTSFPPPSRPTVGTARCTRCRGSSTSACCTGEPIWSRAPRAISAISWSWRGARRAEHRVPFGLVWQGARYEGLVTVFLEYLGALRGRDPRRSRAGRRRFRRRPSRR